MPKGQEKRVWSSRSAIEGVKGEQRVTLVAFFFRYIFFLAKQKESILAAGAAKYPVEVRAVHTWFKTREAIHILYNSYK